MLSLARKDIINQYSSYILSILLKRDCDIVIGCLGKCRFKRGMYLYVGSGKKNLYERIRRHLKNTKRIYWHIDYLLEYADIKDVWISQKEESEISRILEARLEIPIDGFGSTDKVGDKSHLFFGILSPKLMKEIDLCTIFSF